jgi:hypothetical protein
VPQWKRKMRPEEDGAGVREKENQERKEGQRA